MDDHKVTIIDILNSVFDGTYGITVEPYVDRDDIDGIQIMVDGSSFFKTINLPPNGEISEEGVDDILDYTKGILAHDLENVRNIGVRTFMPHPREVPLERALMLINKNDTLKESTDGDWDFVEESPTKDVMLIFDPPIIRGYPTEYLVKRLHEVGLGYYPDKSPVTVDELNSRLHDDVTNAIYIYDDNSVAVFSGFSHSVPEWVKRYTIYNEFSEIPQIDGYETLSLKPI
jgi:hypothetical protein